MKCRLEDEQGLYEAEQQMVETQQFDHLRFLYNLYESFINLVPDELVGCTGVEGSKLADAD